jgi:hypothetical protein
VTKKTAKKNHLKLMSKKINKHTEIIERLADSLERHTAGFNRQNFLAHVTKIMAVIEKLCERRAPGAPHPYRSRAGPAQRCSRRFRYSRSMDSTMKTKSLDLDTARIRAHEEYADWKRYLRRLHRYDEEYLPEDVFDGAEVTPELYWDYLDSVVEMLDDFALDDHDAELEEAIYGWREGNPRVQRSGQRKSPSVEAGMGSV